MADGIKFVRKKKPAAEGESAPITQEQQGELLSKAGGVAMSGLHTFGSVLSWPSRIGHGLIHGLSGGKHGFGENILNPLDSRGGIEGSRHLIDAGILKENDPTKWEWGDLGRGVADAALDPTTYIAGLGLTGKGLKAAKAGTLAGSRIAQLARGERALLTAGIPFVAPNAVAIGTGRGVARTLHNIGKRTGYSKVSKAIAQSAPVRIARAGFDATVQGLTHPTIQRYMPNAFKGWKKAQRETDAEITRMARSGLANVDDDTFRMAAEGVSPVKATSYVPHPSTIAPDVDAEISKFVDRYTGSSRNRTPNQALEDLQFYQNNADRVEAEMRRRQTAPVFDEPHVLRYVNPHTLAGSVEGLPDDVGEHLDDILAAKGDIHAPVFHLTPEGQIRPGGLVEKSARKRAIQEYKAGGRELTERLAATPTHVQTPHAQVIEAMNRIAPQGGSLVSIRDLRRELPNMSKQDLDRTIVELSQQRQLQGHHHDFATSLPQDELDTLLDTGRDIHANQGRYWVGVARPRDAGQLPEDLARMVNPEHQRLNSELNNYRANKRNFVDLAHERIRSNLHSAHGADEGLDTLAKIKSLNEPGMAIMVPASQAAQFDRLHSVGSTVPSRATTVVDHPEFANALKLNEGNLARHQDVGVGNQSDLFDPFAKHFVRHASVTSETGAKGLGRGGKIMAGSTAEDVGRQAIFKGHAEGTAGINNLLSDPGLHAAIRDAGGQAEAALPYLEKLHGHKVERLMKTHAQRQAVESTKKQLADLSTKLPDANTKLQDLKRQLTELRNAPTDTMGTAELRAHRKEINKLQSKASQALDSYQRIKAKHAAAESAHHAALAAGDDRLLALAKYAAAHPELEGQRLFGNSPLHDLKRASLGTDKKTQMAQAAFRTIADHLNDPKGDNAVRLGDFLESGGFAPKRAAENIVGRALDEPGALDAVLNSTLDSKLVEQLKSLTPSFKAPEYVNEATKALSSGMAWWKGLTLAFPASRARDAIGGVVQNILHGWADPRFIIKDVNDLMSGKIIKRSYAHVPEVQKWLEKSQLPWSPENQTEALRQLVAVHFPSSHNMLGDVPVGQVGAGIEQLTQNVPGQTQKSVIQQAIVDPAKTMVGMGDTGATWLGGPRQPGETLRQRIGRTLSQPFTGVRGVGDAAETTFAPVRASEQVSAASDAFNRYGPFLQQIHGGTAADVAGQNVNRAQISYDPDTFTAFERGIKNHLLPFWSFNSRILPETARQLSDFGSPTSQLVKALDRAHGGGDPSVPDYVMAGTGAPLGTAEDGTKRYVTGLGLMHEPAVSMLGLLAGGNLRPAGYDTLAQLNPMIGVPLQRITGQSFFQRGEPIANLDPTTGRLMSNVGESLGMRDPNLGPVRYPGDAAVDTVLGATPFGRLANQARTLADPRKNIGSKLVDTLTGVRITDVSPGKQLSTRQKRAEDLARAEGAFESRMVGFPKEQIERLKETDPELAARHQELQNLITAIKRKKSANRKSAKKEKLKFVRKEKK